jgi:hypothetical protein
VLTGATAFGRQAQREPRSFVAPPPSATSTGGAANVTPPPPLYSAPRLRGRTLETRDALHPDEIELFGLEASSRPYRADLPLERSPLGENADASGENADLHRRQLAIYSGETVTRLPEVVHAHGGQAPDGSASDAPAEPPSTRWSVVALVGLVVSFFAAHRKLKRVD